MKNTFRIGLLTLSMFMAFKGFAQEDIQVPDMPIDEETKMVSYNEVTPLEGVSAGDQYTRCMKWFQKFYPNPNGVLKVKDSEAGKIVGKAQFKIENFDKKGNRSFAGIVRYTITVLFKEGRYRYEITRINWQKPSYYGIEKWMDKESDYYKKEYDSYLVQTHEKIQKVIESLKEGMADSGVKKKDDW